MPMSRVRQGDMVAVMGPKGTPTFSPVLMMLHASPNIKTTFLQLGTDVGDQLTVTPSHLVMIDKNISELNNNQYNIYSSTSESIITKIEHVPSPASLSVVFADKIVEGDRVLVRRANGSGLEEHTVSTVSSIVELGVFAPLTNEGNVIVDDMVVSCYAVIDSQSLAHWAFLPVRFYYRIKNVVMSTLKIFGLVSSQDANHQISSLANLQNWKPRLKAANLMPNMTISLTSNYSTNGAAYTATERSSDTLDVTIHWYPRLLYFLARYLLPEHLVES